MNRRNKEELSMTEWLISFFPILVVAVLIFNIYQRRYGDRGIKKRMSTFFMAAALVGLFAVIVFLKDKGMPSYYALAYLGVVILSFVLNHKRAFPFQTKCAICGENLGWEEVLFLDSNTHKKCEPAPEPPETQESTETE